MKVILDLEKYTVEYLETTPFIQGTDSRNKIEVLVPHESTTNIMIAYTLASGRSTIAMANKSLTTITYNSASYDNVLFELPSAVTRLEGNICATVIVTLASDSTKHKFNILNTILNSTDFETFEDALTGTAAQVLASLAAMNSNVNATATALNNHKNATNNPHSVTKSQVGLGNVDNTSDADKPISDATQAALDNLQDEINDLGVIAEMPDKIIDVANCFDFTDDKSKVSVDKVETKELKVNNYEDPYNTSFSVDGNGINAHQNDDEDHYAEFEVSGPSLATLAAFKFKWGSEFGDNVITLLDIVNMAQGKTRNYVIDLTATGTNVTNFEFDTTSNAMTLDLLDDGNENKIKLVNNNIVSLKDLKIGDIVSVTQSEVPDRWVGNITSTQITFYSLETKTDSTPTEDSGYPISSGAIWNIIKNAANANTWQSENTFNGTTNMHDVSIDDSLWLENNVEFNVQDFTKIVNRSRWKSLQDSLDQNLYNLGAFDSVSGNVITRQTGYVDLGSLNWTLDTSIASYNYFTASPTWLNIQIPSSGAVVADIVTSKYTTRSWESMISNLSDNSICLNDGAYNLIRIRDTTYNDANVFKASLNGVILQYKLATSYTETIIENQPLNTLDQTGSNWLKKEWEKGLNLIDLHITTNTESSKTISFVKNGTFNISFSGTYTINSSYATSWFLKIVDSNNTEHYIGPVGGSNPQTATITNIASITYRDFVTSGSIDIMLTESNHAYPYQAYNGAIVHEKDITPVLLWENASPTSDFASGNITALENPLNYKYIVVKFKTYKTNDEVKIQKFGSVAGTTSFNGTFYTSSKLWNVARNITFANSTTISIDVGVYQEEGTTGTSNGVAIPLAIYGTNVL